MRNFQTWLSQTVRLVLSRSHRRIIFVGLDGSGKTTIINQIIAMGDDNQRPAPEPTVEFKVHTVDYKRWKLFITVSLRSIVGENRVTDVFNLSGFGRAGQASHVLEASLHGVAGV